MSRQSVSPLVSRLGVVFGHYDSRGGTMFVPIAEATEAEVTAAFTYYNKEIFDYDEDTDRANGAGIGRECDILVDQMMRDGQSPADEDFQFVARLWYRTDAWPEDQSDLEEVGVVLQREDTKDPRWTGGPEPPYTSPYEGGPAFDTPEYKAMVKASRDWRDRYDAFLRTAPYPITDLEFVPIDIEGLKWYELDEAVHIALARERASTDWGKRVDRVPDWNDDAYGFVVVNR